MDQNLSALKCPHRDGFVFHHFAGRGYQVECQDCQCKGAEHPIAGVAMANFERAVSKARATERRELKKQSKEANV